MVSRVLSLPDAARIPRPRQISCGDRPERLGRKFHCGNLARSLHTAPLMKPIIFSVVVLLGFAGAMREFSTAQAATDTNLQVTITRQNQNAVLSWLGSNSVAYQVEASSTLATWTNLGPVFVGNGNTVSVTNPVGGQEWGFYRVKKLLLDSSATATFDPGTGVLTILGNAQPNLIVVSRDVTGALRVNNGTVSITGGVPTVANTTLIQIFGQAGSDQLALDESNGALPMAHLFGEADNDTLTGGSGADVLNGGPGDDTLFGRGGPDSLIGGDDNDTVT